MLAEFNAYTSVGGGVLIGISTTVLLLLNGRLAGVSGVCDTALSTDVKKAGWAWIFLLGIVLGNGCYEYLLAPSPTPLYDAPVVAVIGGLMVGFGTRMGNGCTSGHGICGLSRFSSRSLLAVISFVGSGVIAVYLMHHVFDFSL